MLNTIRNIFSWVYDTDKETHINAGSGSGETLAEDDGLDGEVRPWLEEPASAPNTWIEWHQKDGVPIVLGPGDENCPVTWTTPRPFGILNISSPDVPPSTRPIALFINIDKSISMSEISVFEEVHGWTKIMFVKQTLKNMLQLFMEKIEENPAMTVYVCIAVFFHDVEMLRLDTDGPSHIRDELSSGFVKLTQETLAMFIDKIDQIRPEGLTNIERSLHFAQKQLHAHLVDHPDHRAVHIHLSDGDATSGAKSIVELSSCVDHTYKNIFIGYGEDHDSFLLNQLAGDIGEYRFVDKVEQCGMVCGEIAYHILHPVYDHPITIKMGEGSRIYHWKTNKWVSSLQIPFLSSNSTKTFHITTFDDSQPVDGVYATLVHGNNHDHVLETIRTLPMLLDLHDNYVSNDLTLNILRQLTQEFLFRAQAYELKRRSHKLNKCGHAKRWMGKTATTRFNFEDDPSNGDTWGTQAADTNPSVAYETLMLEMQDHFNKLKATLASMTDCKKNTTFVRVLMDDMYVTMKHLGTKKSYMYSSSRQTSQGNQYVYSPSGIRPTATDSLDGVADGPLIMDPNYQISSNHETSYSNDTVLDYMQKTQSY